MRKLVNSGGGNQMKGALMDGVWESGSTVLEVAVSDFEFLYHYFNKDSIRVWGKTISKEV